MSTPHPHPELQQALQLTVERLARSGYSETEVGIAMSVFDALMMNISINAALNHANGGKVLAALITLLGAMDSAAHQDAAKIVGHTAGGGKN